jgi:hypothetical protein
LRYVIFLNFQDGCDLRQTFASVSRGEPWRDVTLKLTHRANLCRLRSKPALAERALKNGLKIAGFWLSHHISTGAVNLAPPEELAIFALDGRRLTLNPIAIATISL